MNEEQIKKLIADAIKAGNDAQAEALKKTLADAVSAATQAMNDSITKLRTDLDAIKAAPPPDPKKDDDKNKTKDDAGAEAAKALMAELLKPVLEKLGALEKKDSDAAAAAETRARVEAWLTAKRPNLPAKARAVFLGRLVAGSPKDDAAIEQAFGAMVEEHQALGTNVTPFAADFKGEGGVAATPEGKKAHEDAAVEAIKKQGPVGRL